MDTNTPAVKADITEADVIAWLNAQRAEYSVPEWAHVSVSAAKYAKPFSVYGSEPTTYNHISGDGATFEEAAANFAAKLSPTGAALAHKLLKESDELKAKALAILAGTKEAA